MLPRKSDERVEKFQHCDDAEFAILRRKLARFAADNAEALKAAKPVIPLDLDDREADNWSLLLAVAELAGGDWPERTHEAAVRLTRKGRRPSDGVLLLAALKKMFTANGTELTSEYVAAEFRKDQTSIWVTYNRGGPITQRQIAILLDQYDIHPVPIHPTKRKDFARQGYKLAQFEDAFARYLPADPIIQSPASKQKRKTSKPKLKTFRKRTR